MKVVEAWPPDWVIQQIERLDPAFRTRAEIVSTYNGIIYNPRGIELSPSVIAHEKVHATQQTKHLGGPRAYLERYITDDQFRLKVEVEAYRAELAYLIVHGEKEHPALRRIAKKLLNPVYGFDRSFHLTLAGAESMLTLHNQSA